MSSPGQRDAQQAAAMQTKLFKDYAATGLPALKGAMGYASAAANQGLPGYAQEAYAQAATGASAQRTANFTSLRQRLAAGTHDTASGGQFLAGLSDVAASAGDSYSREMAGIRTSNAVAGLEQRNKLLNVLAGGGATGTSLSASFGALGNQAIGYEQPNQAFGLAMGGASAGLGIYAALNQQQQPNSALWGQNNYQYGQGAVGTAGAVSRLPPG